MHLAIFDLDNTLIGGDSDHAWGEFLAQNSDVDSAAYKAKNDQFYQDYLSGSLDIIRYQEFVLEPLTRFSVTQRQQLHAEFMRLVIESIRLPKAQALIESHRAQGHCLLIITATNHFITAPIAAALGINNLIATEGTMIDGEYTGTVEGTPSFGQGKIIRLQEWLKQQPNTFSEQTFYSDSHNDLPLLNTVDHPVAVDPDDKLRAIATANGWPILSLRD